MSYVSSNFLNFSATIYYFPKNKRYILIFLIFVLIDLLSEKTIELKWINLKKNHPHWFIINIIIIIIQIIARQTKIKKFMDKNLNNFFICFK